MDTGYGYLCDKLKNHIEVSKNLNKSFSENKSVEILFSRLNTEITSFKKYLLMMSILNMLDTFSIKFWDYCSDEDGEIIESERDYRKIITEKNYSN